MKLGILFDLDGTLLDTLEDLYNAINHTLRHFGCPERSLDEVRRFVGNGARMLVRLALPGKDTDPTEDEALAYYQAYYNANCRNGSTAPYPGILEALAKVAEKHPVAVVSNKPDPAAKTLCKEYFGRVYALGVSDDCPRKPAPDMVYKAMDQLGVDRCIYVGDSEVDVETAKNAGVPCLSVLWGFRDKACLLAAGADHFCDDPCKLPEILEQMIYGQ